MSELLQSLSWSVRAELILVACMLALLALAPRLEKSPWATTLLGLFGALAAAACGFQFDDINRFGLFVVGGAMAAAMLLLHGAELFDGRQRPEAAALIIVGGLGALVIVLSSTLLEIAIGVEMLSLSSATLVALGRGRRALEAGFKYFLLSALTFAMFLFGMALMFLAAGHFNIDALHEVFGAARGIALAGAALMAMGLAFKLALFPVHFGALDAYTAGPASLVGFIMVGSKLGAAAGLVKLALGAGMPVQSLLMGVGLATLGVGVLASFAQTDLRRLLAYSAVAHAGFIALGASATNQSRETTLFYVLSYGVAAALAFAALAGTGAAGDNDDDERPIARLGTGLGRVRALVLLLALLSLAGVPPLPGFWAKLAVLMATWKTFGAVPTLLAALGGVVGVIYYLRPMPDLLAQTKADGPALPAAVVGAMLLLGGALVFLTVGPGWGFWLAGG